ncbi:hypothetical protein YB2330_004445 [Saitoella coloradoensis]
MNVNMNMNMNQPQTNTPTALPPRHTGHLRSQSTNSPFGMHHPHAGPVPIPIVPVPRPELTLRDILERWTGNDDTLRLVLQAKIAADRVRVEEERTRRVALELEIVREAGRMGVDPVRLLGASGGRDGSEEGSTGGGGGGVDDGERERERERILAAQGLLRAPQPQPRSHDPSNPPHPNVAAAAAAAAAAGVASANGAGGVPLRQIPVIPSRPTTSTGEDSSSNTNKIPAISFHHWQPPAPIPTTGPASGSPTRGTFLFASEMGIDGAGGSVNGRDGMHSPPKRKRTASNSLGVGHARGHARHRSEASALSFRVDHNLNTSGRMGLAGLMNAESPRPGMGDREGEVMRGIREETEEVGGLGRVKEEPQ